MNEVGAPLGGNLTAPGEVVVRRGRAFAATITYTCDRCGAKGRSQPMPEDLSLLAIYGLPDGWVLIVQPRGEDDVSWCVECQRAVGKGGG